MDEATGAKVEEDLDDAAAEAQMLAGFGGSDTPTEKPGQETPDPPEQTPAPAKAPEYVQITKDVLDELMALRTTVPALKELVDKQFGTAFGKMGGLERWKSEMDSNAATANELRGKITDAQIDALRPEFPEHAAALDILRKMPAIPVAPDTKGVDEMVQQRLGAVLPSMIDQQVELRDLTKAHPDWREVKDEPGFTEYRNKLQEAERTKLDNAWDATFVGGHIAAYKKSKLKQADPAAVHDINQRRASRMAAAELPRGSGEQTGADNPEAQLLEGFSTRRVGNQS